MGNSSSAKVVEGTPGTESQPLIDGVNKKPLLRNDIDGIILSSKLFAWGILSFQLLLILFFGLFTNPYSTLLTGDDYTDFSAGYNLFSGVLIMMVVGFANLMTFIVNYEIGSVAFTLMITVVGLQWGIFNGAFFDQLATQTFEYVKLDIYTLINGLYAVAAVLISFGGVIGKLSPWQLLIMTIIELIFYSLNEKIFMIHTFGLQDIGGTIIIHEFGAFFGLAVAFMYGLPNSKIRAARYSDVFSFIGTIFLWIYWPSFVAAEAVAGSTQQQMATVNTVLALLASSCVTFGASILLSNDFKLRAPDIQNATLAGGVAVGSIANLTLDPFTVIIVGSVAGLVSTFGFHYIQPFLEESIGLHDSCGIHNLHGMPSLIGGFASVVVAAWKTSGDIYHDSAIYGPNASNQWEMQLSGVIVTFVVAVSSGCVTGLLLKAIEPSTYYEHFKDSIWFYEEEEEEEGHGDKDKDPELRSVLGITTP